MTADSPQKLRSWALFKVIEQNDVEAVKTCLSQGINVNARDLSGYTALYRAAEVRNEEMMRLLIAHGADINHENSTGMTGLMDMALDGNVEGLRLLIKYGAAVDMRRGDGSTALILAAYYAKNPEILRVLIEAGADMDVRNNNGDAPLAIAERNGKAENAQVIKDIREQRLVAFQKKQADIQADMERKEAEEKNRHSAVAGKQQILRAHARKLGLKRG